MKGLLPAAATSLPSTHAPSAENTLNSAPLPHSRSYAQALKGQANTLEMGEIRQLLNYISNYIKEMDIIILRETWSTADAITYCPPNYREIILPSQKLSTVRQGRDSGGQIIWYKSKFHNHINTVKQGKCYTWLKIHKELLSYRKDIFLCAIYIPPSESPYYSEDTFSTLEEETSHFQAQGNVLICGDLNARTGLQPDFTDTQGSIYINNKLTVINSTLSHIHRNNYDHIVNKDGKETSGSSVEAWV